MSYFVVFNVRADICDGPTSNDNYLVKHDSFCCPHLNLKIVLV